MILSLFVRLAEKIIIATTTRDYTTLQTIFSCSSNFGIISIKSTLVYMVDYI